jgi:hypothetical protein
MPHHLLTPEGREKAREIDFNETLPDFDVSRMGTYISIVNNWHDIFADLKRKLQVTEDLRFADITGAKYWDGLHRQHEHGESFQGE